MLVLTRKSGEAIVIRLPNGEEIVIKMKDFAGKQVRIGITAPEECVIYREELLTKTEN